jgi:ubiquinone/menaquinone biosynthesis C-methylase UbiE
MGIDDRVRRENDFWGHHIPGLEDCLAEFHAKPDANTEAMLQAVEPTNGKRVLDFACGTGVVSAWLASRGAEVVGLDPSPDAIAIAEQVCHSLSLPVHFISQTIEEATDLGEFDAIVGRYALHHTDVPATAIRLAEILRNGGKAAFVETFNTNPILRLCRSHLIGRVGIPRLGTLDEHPLGPKDVQAIRRAFGHAHSQVAELRFFRIFDRQVLQYRSSKASKICGQVDDLLHRLPRSASLSYHQVVVAQRTLL